ncbi:hypothetical protein [Sphingobacterium hungaricum]|uniref:Uncharacterized protein n=1 Tax=Sphingobacterium hungaricum TaxID=2082723 RepID=A0A928V133_9SPHI|nr:hypothetical protein [Sphingobacterium hungaricum]MBE8714729.1 hypothetical protein [Sphingobacterium hungaricum]
MLKYAIILFLVFNVALKGIGQTVYTTPSGKKYHTATCHHIKNVSHKRTLVDAEKLGFTPCSQCNPKQQEQAGFVSTPSSGGLGIKRGEARGIKSIATQCKAIAKSTGKRCKHMTKNVNGYCAQHEQ